MNKGEYKVWLLQYYHNLEKFIREESSKLSTKQYFDLTFESQEIRERIARLK